jgi:hypothetical protein
LPRWARWGTPPAYGAGLGADYGPPPREQEIEMLKDQAEWLREELEAIGRRMDELGEE